MRISRFEYDEGQRVQESEPIKRTAATSFGRHGFHHTLYREPSF